MYQHSILLLPMELTFYLIVFLFFVALAAGFIDTIAGGGGLLTVPAMMLVGIPPINALATNKFQGVFGTLTATTRLYRKGVLNKSTIKRLFPYAFIGSAIGTIVLQFINAEILSFIIPAVLVIIAGYFLLAPNVSQPKKAKLSAKQYQYFVAPIIGFYDGFFGPGTGSFFTFSKVYFAGKDILTATANAKVMNFATNLASLIIFLFGGQILWLMGLIMIIGQIIGAWIAAHVVVSKGSQFIRPIIVVMCILMLSKYFIDFFNN